MLVQYAAERQNLARPNEFPMYIVSYGDALSWDIAAMCDASGEDDDYLFLPCNDHLYAPALYDYVQCFYCGRQKE